MIGLVVGLLVLLGIAWLAWQVLEVAVWIAVVIFIVGAVIVLGGYGWLRKRLGAGSQPPD